MRNRLFIIILLIAAAIMAACRRSNPEAAALLARADSLLNPPPSTAARSQGADTPPAGGPQGALHLLDSVQHQARTAWPKADRMRYEVLLAEAMNKSYKPFTTDSVLKQVVRYYDRHGSNDEQLKAHYLLGCAYRDMGEAPAAINAWQEAVDCADTLRTDCDYNTLYRVYGQMAEIYTRQYLTDKALEAQKFNCRYAILAGDTLYYIHGLLMLADNYYALKDTDAVFQHIEQARLLYLERGMRHEAARVYPTAIQIALEHGHYKRAHRMLHIFEQESGLFDEDGNISEGYQKYYYHKGNYYLGVNQPDSAEKFFRKLLPIPSNTIDGYRGLGVLFQSESKVDSALKYAHLYEFALVDYLNATQAEAVRQAASMYDYTRNEQDARVKSIEAKRTKNILQGVLCTAFLIISLIYITYRRYREKRTTEVMQLSKLYQDTSRKLSSTLDELSILNSENKTLERLKQEYAEKLQVQSDNTIEKNRTIAKLLTQNRQIKEDMIAIQKNRDLLIAKKDKEVEVLRKGIKHQHDQLMKLKAPEREIALKDTDIVKFFIQIGQPHKNSNTSGSLIVPAREATEKEWTDLSTTFQKYLPTFIAYLTEEVELSSQEYKACLLFRLNLPGNEIATLLGTSSPRISKLKGILNAKLFSSDKISKFLMNLKKL